jgi:hypothetical protein
VAKSEGDPIKTGLHFNEHGVIPFENRGVRGGN